MPCLLLYKKSLKYLVALLNLLSLFLVKSYFVLLTSTKLRYKKLSFLIDYLFGIVTPLFKGILNGGASISVHYKRRHILYLIMVDILCRDPIVV